MARAIDADILLQNFDDMEPYEECESEHDLWLDMRMEVIHAPTLTPQNEWISVEERLPEPGDLIVYADNTVWGYQYGICRVCGKEKAFDYWIPLQDPPNNRPPEGEET